MSNVTTMRNHGLFNVGHIIAAAEEAHLPLPAACAMMERETHGKNIYGHDRIVHNEGTPEEWIEYGALSGFPGEVNRGNWEVFRWMVFDRGGLSNGVGPAQITSKGLLLSMETQDLQPWAPRDNMLFGFKLLKAYFNEGVKAKVQEPWTYAGTRYNGSEIYGADLRNKVHTWQNLLA